MFVGTLYVCGNAICVWERIMCVGRLYIRVLERFTYACGTASLCLRILVCVWERLYVCGNACLREGTFVCVWERLTVCVWGGRGGTLACA
jgi:hypothetical protein